MQFHLQRFADTTPSVSETSNEVAENPTPVENKESTNNGNTEIDIDSKIKTALEKMQAQMTAAFEEKFKKNAALSKLSDEERQKAELENARAELEKQKAAFTVEKIKYEAAKVLSARNLPVDFVDYLIGEDNESTLENIKTFEKKFNKAVEDAVTAKLKGKAPQTCGKSVEGGSKKEAFMKTIYDAQIQFK